MSNHKKQPHSRGGRPLLTCPDETCQVLTPSLPSNVQNKLVGSILAQSLKELISPDQRNSPLTPLIREPDLAVTDLRNHCPLPLALCFYHLVVSFWLRS